MRKIHSKKQAQFKHAKERFIERCGINIGKKGLTFIKKRIQQEQGVFVKKNSNRISVWDVLYLNETYRVLYDKQRKSIVTVLGYSKDMRTSN